MGAAGEHTASFSAGQIQFRERLTVSLVTHKMNSTIGTFREALWISDKLSFVGLELSPQQDRRNNAPNPPCHARAGNWQLANRLGRALSVAQSKARVILKQSTQH